MRIGHMALYVTDLEQSKEFFGKYFGAIPNEKYRNPHTGLETYFLRFGDCETRLELMTRPDLAEKACGAYPPGYAHIAFSLESREAVDRLTEELRKDGYQIISEPRVTGDGYYESCVSDPEGNPIEITD